MGGTESSGGCDRIADLRTDDRPRERAYRHGAGSLSDSELLAILLGTGTPGRSALSLARGLLARAENDLDRLGRFTLDDFKKERGIGDAKALTLLAALELGRRRGAAMPGSRIRIETPEDIFSLMGPSLRDKSHEEIWALYLNRSNTLLRRARLAAGGVYGAHVEVRAIAREALDLHATGVALCHNHPSGDPRPSPEDVEITQRLLRALALFDIHLVDHVVIGTGSFHSMRREGSL